MYDIIKNYIKTAITDLKEYDLSFDLDLIPANQMDSYYFIKLETIDEDGYEYSRDTVGINLELWFLLANNSANYGKAIDKVNEIKQNLKALEPYSSTDFAIDGTENVKVNNLNNIIKGNWLKCNINFELKTSD